MTAKLPSIHITHCKILPLAESLSAHCSASSSLTPPVSQSVSQLARISVARTRCKVAVVDAASRRWFLHLVTSHSLEGSICILSGAPLDTCKKHKWRAKVMIPQRWKGCCCCCCVGCCYFCLCCKRGDTEEVWRTCRRADRQHVCVCVCFYSKIAVAWMDVSTQKTCRLLLLKDLSFISMCDCLFLFFRSMETLSIPSKFFSKWVPHSYVFSVTAGSFPSLTLISAHSSEERLCRPLMSKNDRDSVDCSFFFFFYLAFQLYRSKDQINLFELHSADIHKECKRKKKTWRWDENWEKSSGNIQLIGPPIILHS